MQIISINGLLATVYDHLPKGWNLLSGARTAPYGYKWISNGMSRFSNAYEHALLRVGDGE